MLDTCEALPDLEWLSNITSVNGGIGISKCNSLQNIDGLRNLTNIIGSFITVSHNQSLENLNGFQNLNASILGFTLVNNPSLLNINGIENIDVTYQLKLINNYILEDLRGLDKITSLIDDVVIERNNSLTDLQGLNNLALTRGSFSISDNESLTSLDGLSNLSNVLSLGVSSNSLLTDFCYLQNLLSVNPEYQFSARDNAYNPTNQDIIDGNCAI